MKGKGVKVVEKSKCKYQKSKITPQGRREKDKG